MTTLFKLISPATLEKAIKIRWGEKAALPTKLDGMTIAGLIGHLGQVREFREWDFKNGPRGG